MFDFRGRKLRKASPSTPVQVMGLNDVPSAGEVFQVVPSEREARAIIDERKAQAAQKQTVAHKATLEELFNNFKSGELKELRLIIKADVQGSIDPIITALKEVDQSEIKINILHTETGNISDNDVMLATASRAIVIGFNVQADTAARRLAEAEGVDLRLYNIIYRMQEDLEKAVKGMLKPAFIETVVGKADVLAVFRISKVGSVAGCKVTSGELRRNGKARVFRRGEKIYEGEVSSLKHEKDDVREVRQGFECGVSFRNFDEYAVGDQIECYILEKND